MGMIFRYMKRYSRSFGFVMVLKLLATMTELLLPYIFEHLLDDVVPRGVMKEILFWGGMMILCAVLTWIFNVCANRKATDNSRKVAYDIRKDVFEKTLNLSGAQFDAFGLPSLTSRMTSDSYNVQNFARSVQTICVRAPILLVGGIIMTMTMDMALSGILCAIVPLMLLVTITVSRKGIPLFHKVQNSLDNVVRVMRENITGVRVVKALSKTEYEKGRFHEANDRMTQDDIHASTYMAVPGPFMQFCLNVGLTLVVFVGAGRVNSGAMESAVILAFLTYFNMIMQSVMAINRIFMMTSKASASVNRMNQVLLTEPDQPVLTAEETGTAPSPDFIVFDHVNFGYHTLHHSDGNASGFLDEGPQQCLYDIHFTIRKGESLGIIGPTGCGKTTVLNLLMRFYDADSGQVYIDGRDVRSYQKDELHRKFGVVFQNDLVFNDTLRNNISFGRDLDDTGVQAAIRDAMAAEFIDDLQDGLEHVADIKGANLSGGQKQRLLISRALAGHPEILILDDSSSALDYQTDAMLRKAIRENHGNSTTIMIAQRVSSIMGMTHILVMDSGHMIGYGTHEQLLASCPVYRETYEIQMNKAFMDT